MKVLQLTHKPPVPSIDGGCLAMHQITSNLLTEGAEVKVVSIATDKHPVIVTEKTLSFFNKTAFEAVYVDTGMKIMKIIYSFLKRTSLQVDRFFSTKMVQKLKELLLVEKFDVIILESTFVGHYLATIRKYSQARVILRVHNVEYLIWERLYKQTKNPLKKLAYKYLSTSLKRFEFALFKKIDGYMPITEVDYQFFRKIFPTIPAKVVPFAINLSEYQYQEHKIDQNRISLFHIGSMNWQPNIEGMNWFLDNVWKGVSEKYPQLTLALAGKGNQAIFENRKLRNVEIFDFVENSQQFINKYDIMVVPLLSGSGMRIKIMEGLALGKPIITTTIGAEGIEITDKENIFIADTPEAMMQTIDFCIAHLDKCEEVGKNARDLIEEKYSQEIINKELMAMLTQCFFI